MNPMAETLARIFHMEANAAATWQQVATVIVVELLIAFALIAYELLGTARHGEFPARVRPGEPAAPETAHATASAAELPPLDTRPASAELRGLPLQSWSRQPFRLRVNGAHERLSRLFNQIVPRATWPSLPWRA